MVTLCPPLQIIRGECLLAAIKDGCRPCMSPTVRALIRQVRELSVQYAIHVAVEG
jgi:hypothetical protein